MASKSGAPRSRTAEVTASTSAGADDAGDLGLTLREISIASVDPEGLAQYRSRVALRPGMVLRAINGVPVARLAYDAVCELAGLGDNSGSADVRGLTMCFHRPD